MHLINYLIVKKKITSWSNVMKIGKLSSIWSILKLLLTKNIFIFKVFLICFYLSLKNCSIRQNSIFGKTHDDIFDPLYLCLFVISY